MVHVRTAWLAVRGFVAGALAVGMTACFVGGSIMSHDMPAPYAMAISFVGGGLAGGIIFARRWVVHDGPPPSWRRSGGGGG